MNDYWENEAESLEALEETAPPDISADWTDTWDDFESDAYEEVYALDQDPMDYFCEEDWDDQELYLLEEDFFAEHEDFDPDWFEIE